MKNYRIGIDLGGTNIKVGIVDPENRILRKRSCHTLAQRPWQQVADDMVRQSQIVLEEESIAISECQGIGIGCPGSINAATGTVIYSNNLKNWENIPLARYINEKMNLPVQISNDANCAALGECVAGAAVGHNSAVLLTLGTGVGGGVIWDGKVFEGGAGGIELGHTMLKRGGEQCTCGRCGCVEAYCSATALTRDAVRAAKENPNSSLNTLCKGNLQKMNGKIPFDAMKVGDDAAKKVIDTYIEMLGEAITDMVNIFRPEIVLLSGGICAQGETLTRPLTDYVQMNAFAGNRLRTPKVCVAALGNDAGLIGAANLI